MLDNLSSSYLLISSPELNEEQIVNSLLLLMQNGKDMMINRSILSLCWLILTSSFHRLHQSHKLLRKRTVIFDQSSEDGAPLRKKRYDDNEIDFASVLRKCKYSNDYQPAIELAEKALLLRPMPPSILTGVIKVFGEAGQLGRAVSLLKVMKEELNVMPNEYHLGALIAACRRCGQWEMGVVLYNRMDSLNVVKNTIICNNIISTLGDALQWQSVFEILAEMDNLNIKKDIVTYSSAITACVKAGEWERAITLYRMMEKEGIKPNTITLNAVLSACARGRQVRMALDMFSEACKLGIPLDTISYSVVIKVCGDINEFEVALCLFDAMSDDIVTESSKNVLRKDILSTWNSSSTSQFSKEYILDILRTCRKVPRDTGCYNSIITCCERAGKWEIAVDILHSMMKNKGGRNRPDSKTFSAAISCCGKAGQWEEATRIFYQMAAEGARKDTAVYNAMIAALQLAAQRLLLEESLPVSRGEKRGNATSRGLFEMAQQVYAEGLTDGQLQHFAYDLNSFELERSSELQRSGVELSTDDAQYRDYSDSIGHSMKEMSTAATTSNPVESFDVSRKVRADADVVLGGSWVLDPEDLRTIQEEGVSTDHFEEIDSVEKDLGSDSSIDSIGDSTVHSSLTDPLPLPLPFPMASSASISLSSGVPSLTSVRDSRVPRVLDLHRCPLLVAKAAIDFEMKQIYEMCTPADVEMISYSGVESDSGSGSSGSGSGSNSGSKDDSSAFMRDNNRNRDEEHIGGTDAGVGRGTASAALAPVTVPAPLPLSSKRRVSSRTRIRSSKRTQDTAGSISGTHSLSLTAAASSTPSPPSPPHSPPHSNPEDDVHPTPPVQTGWGSGSGSGPESVLHGGESCPYDLHIITGRGRHINSSGTRGVLRLQIKEYLLDNYGISAEKIIGNDGCIIVTRSSVDSWVDKMRSL